MNEKPQRTQRNPEHSRRICEIRKFENRKFLRFFFCSISQLLNFLSPRHSFVLISLFLLSILTPICISAGWVPEVSLEPSGRGFFGKYTGNNDRYNLDGGVDISFALLRWDYIDFYIQYISNLEMAKQVGNITLDPRYIHYFIIYGLKVRKYGFLFKPYYAHDCKHIIDMDPDSNKVVFNRFKFSLSQNFDGFKERFQTETSQEMRTRKVRWNFTYGFYPQTEIIDYLNSRPYYHHDFELILEYPLFFFPQGELFSGLRGRYVISAHDSPRYYRELSFFLEVNLFNSYGCLGVYVENFGVAQDPLKAPDGLSIIGLKYRF
jgi:hypothetical protein